MKRLIIALIMICVMFGIYAGGQADTKVETVDDGVVTLRVWKFGGPQHEREFMLEQIKVFEQRNPDIKINWIYQNYDDRRTKVISGQQGGNLPEVILSDGQSIPEYASLGAIYDYETIAPELVGGWKDRFVPEGWNTGVYEGKVYGVSTYVDTAPMIAYNTKMFKEAGFVDAQGNARPPKDWAEVVSIAKYFSSKGIAGIALPGTNASNDSLIMQGIAYRNGGRILVDDKVTINGPGFIDTLKFYQDLVPYAQPGFTETNFRQSMEIFFQGQTAMAMTMSYAPILRESLGAPADFPYSIAPFPMNSRKTGNHASAAFLMTPTVTFVIPVSVKGEVLDAAVRFVDFWMSEEAQAGWSGSVIEGRVPIMISNLESPDFARVYPDLAKSYKDGKLFEGALPMPGFPGFAESEQLIIQAFQRVLMNIESPKEALDKIQEQIQTIYDKYN